MPHIRHFIKMLQQLYKMVRKLLITTVHYTVIDFTISLGIQTNTNCFKTKFFVMVFGQSGECGEERKWSFNLIKLIVVDAAGRQSLKYYPTSPYLLKFIPLPFTVCLFITWHP